MAYGVLNRKNTRCQCRANIPPLKTSGQGEKGRGKCTASGWGQPRFNQETNQPGDRGHRRWGNRNPPKTKSTLRNGFPKEEGESTDRALWVRSECEGPGRTDEKGGGAEKKKQNWRKVKEKNPSRHHTREGLKKKRVFTGKQRRVEQYWETRERELSCGGFKRGGRHRNDGAARDKCRDQNGALHCARNRAPLAREEDRPGKAYGRGYSRKRDGSAEAAKSEG